MSEDWYMGAAREPAPPVDAPPAERRAVSGVTPTEREALRQAAEAAEREAPSPWACRRREQDDWGWVHTNGGWVVVHAQRPDSGLTFAEREAADPCGAIARYISAADPGVVLRLLSGLDAEAAHGATPAEAVEIVASVLPRKKVGRIADWTRSVHDMTVPDEETAIAALQALAAAGWTLTPPGWVAVPREPTQAMLDTRTEVGILSERSLLDFYRAMVAAAPKPS